MIAAVDPDLQQYGNRTLAGGGVDHLMRPGGIEGTGHSSRLARDLSGGMGQTGDGGRVYAREELVAELGAVLLGDRLEIVSAMANHAAYLGHWVELLKESPRVLLQVLSDARRAPDLICPESGGE